MKQLEIKKIKNLIRHITPPIIFEQLVLLKDFFMYLKANKKYFKFKFNVKKAFIIHSSKTNYSILVHELNKFKIHYMLSNNSIIRKKRLHFIFDNFRKYNIDNCCIVIIDKSYKNNFLSLNYKILENALLICCDSFLKIEYLHRLGLNNVFYLPLEYNCKTDFDSCFKSNSLKLDYFFLRLMFYIDKINFSDFYDYFKNEIVINQNKICMSLPESIERRKEFKNINKHDGFFYFPCLSYRIGWKGCALSYKMIAKIGLNLNYNQLIICEDDACFTLAFYKNIKKLIKLAEIRKIDLINCYTTESGQNHLKSNNYLYQIDNVFIVKRDWTAGAVLNIYSKHFLKLIASYDEKKANILYMRKFQMDQYTKRNSKKFNVFATYPILVNHNINAFSFINKKLNSKLKYDINASIHETILSYQIRNEYKIKK